MKSRSTWRLNKEDDYAAYNLLSAVRGPDAYDHDGLKKLKRIVTQRVRSIVFEGSNDDCAGDWRDDWLNSDEVKQVRVICARLEKRGQQDHIRQHMMEAVQATHKHPIWGKLGSALIAALEGEAYE